MQFTTNSALFIGQNLVALNEVDSTNNYLKELLTNSTPQPEGTVIMAENQFNGRGQVHNKWLAEPGKNLTVSILLCPSFLPAIKQFDLNKVVSLGVADFVKYFLGNNVKIKWPNDIFWEDNKLGGILIENFLSGSFLKQSIIGIGLNINQVNFAPGLKATSFSLISKSEFNLKICLNALCLYLEARYLQLKSGNLEKINQDYLSYLYRLNTTDLYRANGEVFYGEIIGVNSTGQLLINCHTGVKEFSFKEVEFI
ncbi:biotin--[acetyl-CoA-carboxylase] ligase [Solitalea sp. MAHUQ-68]|uniref:Biotin--[acetyl-CoA-carboxylase] ligase n=1 Tax=Solitalea agri TaxID=2953739 RepID=A0A9X2F1P2_9SPHI|nr:biotin--[acetyl-CoA-carboxylase] ligase [Solitalea agri]MCO4293022.1 biotin--[acetyl-CoA-carboxylase] ligase [Solitalea agri]